MPVADDFKSLYQWNTCLEHRRKLTGKDRNISRLYGTASLEASTLLLDSAGHDALTAKFGTHLRLVGRHALALDFITLSVCPFPEKGYLSR
jgi:hypothetical protein